MPCYVWLVLLNFLFASPISAQEQTETDLPVVVEKADILGDWSGVLDVGVMKLTLVLHIAHDEAGALSATVDCLEQNMNGVPIDTIALSGRSLTFEMRNLAAVYEGRLNQDATEFLGTFVQGASFPLTLKRGLALSTPLKRPQEPKPPYPYYVEDVSYENRAAGLTLAGTLTFPRSPEKPPVVLLITGSGAHDRDETLMGHKPFFVLADHLTRQGIAVLRVDDRGVGKSTGTFETATDADFATDVLAGIEYLKTRRDLNTQQIGLIGHSCGGLIAPAVAAQSKDVAFIVMLAGPGVNGEQVMLEQAVLIQRANGANEEIIALDQEIQRVTFAILKREQDSQVAEKQLREAIAKHLIALSDAQKRLGKEGCLQMTFTDQGVEQFVKFINGPWFRYFLTFEPATALQKVKVPVLALFGERDLQVSPKQNAPVVARALEIAGNQDYSTVVLPEHNHLFQRCETGAISEYAKIEETISPEALSTISDWIRQRTRTGQVSK